MLLVSNNNNNITYRNTVDLEAVKKVSVGNSYIPIAGKFGEH